MDSNKELAENHRKSKCNDVKNTSKILIFATFRNKYDKN